MTREQPDRPFRVRVTMSPVVPEESAQTLQSRRKELWIVANEVRNTFGTDLKIAIEHETDEGNQGKKGLSGIESIMILIGTAVLAVRPVLKFIVELVREFGAQRRGKIRIKTPEAETEYEGDLDKLYTVIEYAVERHVELQRRQKRSVSQAETVDVEIIVPAEE